MAAVHFLWSLSNDTPMLNHSTRICRSQGFCDNCCHSCHRVVADCVSMLNGLQEPLHPSCNRATLIVFESLITNSLKAQRFFNYFKKLKKRWGKLMKHLAIREGENFFCLREILFRLRKKSFRLRVLPNASSTSPNASSTFQNS